MQTRVQGVKGSRVADNYKRTATLEPLYHPRSLEPFVLIKINTVAQKN